MQFYESNSGETHLISAKISHVNTTSAGYVGIANTTVTTGQSLDVRTFGGTSTYHTGLSTGSTYYVQSNGTFSTTADASVGVNIPPSIPPKIITGVIKGKKAFKDAFPLSFHEAFVVTGGKLWRFAKNFTIIIRLTPTNMPGIIPAKNSAATLSPITYA